MQQEAQRDAPDPRESRPPCYSDAILMPRLDGSFASLDELRFKNKRRKRKAEDGEEIDVEVGEEEEVLLRRNRCRSEEVISMRETVTRSVRSPRLPPRIHPIEIETIDRSLSPAADEAPTRIESLADSPGQTRRARSPVASVHLVVTSIQPSNDRPEEIRNFNQSNNTLEGSPYSKRKLAHMGSSRDKSRKSAPASSTAQASKITKPSTTAQPSTGSIEIIDDHFERERRNSSTESEDSSEFINIKVGKQTGSNSSSNEDGLVVVHRPTSF